MNSRKDVIPVFRGLVAVELREAGQAANPALSSVSAGDVAAMLAEGAALCRNPASRFSFVRQGDGLLLFVDGECFDCAGDVAALAETLCAQDHVSVDPSDAGLDPDGDLYANFEEWRAGTSPNEWNAATSATIYAEAVVGAAGVSLGGLVRTNARHRHDRWAGDVLLIATNRAPLYFLTWTSNAYAFWGSFAAEPLVHHIVPFLRKHASVRPRAISSTTPTPSSGLGVRSSPTSPLTGCPGPQHSTPATRRMQL